MDLKLGTEGFDVRCKKCGKYHYAKRYALAKMSAEKCKCKKLRTKSE